MSEIWAGCPNLGHATLMKWNKSILEIVADIIMNISL